MIKAVVGHNSPLSANFAGFVLKKGIPYEANTDQEMQKFITNEFVGSFVKFVGNNSLNYLRNQVYEININSSGNVEPLSVYAPLLDKKRVDTNGLFIASDYGLDGFTQVAVANEDVISVSLLIKSYDLVEMALTNGFDINEEDYNEENTEIIFNLLQKLAIGGNN